MGKNKKQPIPTKKKASPDLHWEELLDAKDMAVNALIGQQLNLQALTTKHKEDIAKNPELAKVIAGLALTYKDIADSCRLTMDKHMTFDENNTILSYKQGVVNQNSDEFFEYLNISKEYIGLSESVATCASTAFTDIFTELKTYDVKKFKEEMSKSKEELDKTKLGAVDGK